MDSPLRGPSPTLFSRRRIAIMSALLASPLLNSTTVQQAVDKQVSIPVFEPLIEQDELAAATEALEMGWLGMGSYVGRFEQACKEYLGCTDRFVAAVSTGHAALHL